jgi:AraC-like DNA-binding protein
MPPSAPRRRPERTALKSHEDTWDEVPIEFVREALEQVIAQERDSSALLEAASISPELLKKERASVSPAQFARLWHLIVAETGDEFFLLDPRGIPAGSYTIMCHAVLHSPTLERALRRALRLFGILLSDFDFRLERIGASVEIIFVEKGPPRSAFAYATILVLLLGLACWLIDLRIPLQEVEFRSPPPPSPDRYCRLLHEGLRFDRPVTKIRFDAAYLKHQPKRTEDQMRRFLRDAPEGFLVRYRNRDSLSARIWDELRVTPPEDWPSFQQLSSKLVMTASTLRRRLGEEGGSYQKIKDEVRRERAIRQLKLGVKSNAEVAAELGFGDPSAFYRAFKKWTGGRPVDFRPSGAAGERD